MLSAPRTRSPFAAWTHRWLLWSFTSREVTSRYAGSVAGFIWAVAHPLALLAVYAFVFTAVFRVKLPLEVGTSSYVAFLAVILWPWLMFVDGLVRGAGAIRANEGLVRKVAFPHRLLIYSAVFSSFAVHAVGYVSVIAVLRFLGEPIALSKAPAALALIAILMIATIGIAAFLAAVQTLLRDIEHVISVLTMLLFYATPILYPASLVPPGVRPWLEANPLSRLVERLREVLLNNSGLVPGDLWMLLVAVAIFFAGLWVFERLSPHFEDFL
jgi:lipopolysaccharide transport system permease protein